MGLQLTLMAAMIRMGVHYLPATALAVEATVLHNFVWHQRWTWRDRRTASPRASAARLARFQLLNGSVSLCGNLALMSLLSGRAGLDPIAANILSIGACSFLNFAGSHALVFAASRPQALRRIGAIAVAAGASIVPLSAAGESASPVLQPTTLSAWQSYERQVDERYQRATANAFFAGDAFGRSPGTATSREAITSSYEPDSCPAFATRYLTTWSTVVPGTKIAPTQ